MLFAYFDYELDNMKSDGILGLSNDVKAKNFLDYAEE